MVAPVCHVRPGDLHEEHAALKSSADYDADVDEDDDGLDGDVYDVDVDKDVDDVDLRMAPSWARECGMSAPG